MKWQILKTYCNGREHVVLVLLQSHVQAVHGTYVKQSVLIHKEMGMQLL